MNAIYYEKIPEIGVFFYLGDKIKKLVMISIETSFFYRFVLLSKKIGGEECVCVRKRKEKRTTEKL